MSEENNELPRGWVWTTIGVVAETTSGGTPSRKHPEYYGGTIAWVKSGELKDSVITSVEEFITEEGLTSSNAKVFQQGTALVAMYGATVGRTGILGVDATTNQAVCAIFPLKNAFTSKYLTYWLQFQRQALVDQSVGGAQPNINQEIVRAFPLPLAPFSEQHRIVAAIEQQFTRLDAGVIALRRAQTKLKRYRAAVLKAAVEGKLTEAWRIERPETEPASALLERILKERRARWEADLKAKGKDPAKVKYSEPAKPNTENLPELPEGWCWASLDQCSRRITDGTHQPPPFTETGISFIFVSHIVKGSISFENTKYISESTYAQLNTRCPVEYGDILYSAVGSYGVAVPVLTHRAFSFQRHIAHIKPSVLLSMSYLVLCLNSSFCLDQAHKVARGVAQKTVTLTDLAHFAIPLAPFNEQNQIVAEVEQRLSVVAQLEAIVQANLKRAERLRQSILKEAFAGRLVPQDPDDEPASVLLERIRKERDRRKKETASNGRYLHVPHEPVQKIHVEGTQQAELWENVGGG